jgi:hypothetical protein
MVLNKIFTILREYIFHDDDDKGFLIFFLKFWPEGRARAQW